MRDDDDFTEIEIPDLDEVPLDPVAARTASFTRLLALVDHVKDDEAKKEALLMLRAIRLSFKTLPVGDLTAIAGGKQ